MNLTRILCQSLSCFWFNADYQYIYTEKFDPILLQFIRIPTKLFPHNNIWNIFFNSSKITFGEFLIPVFATVKVADENVYGIWTLDSYKNMFTVTDKQIEINVWQQINSQELTTSKSQSK